MNDKGLIAGIGNIFLGDDAFGVEVVNRLRARSLPDHVSLVDFGIRSYDLAYALMDDWDLVILIDALARGAVPGTLYVMDPELPERDDRELPVDDPKVRQPDITRARAQLNNWGPQVEFDEGIRITIDYFRKKLAA